MGRKTCSVESTKEKAIKGREARLEISNEASIPLVKIQTSNKSEVCKNTQNRLNRQLFCEVINGIQPDTERSADESDYPYEVFTVVTDLEGITEKLHTEIKRTNGHPTL